MTLFKVNEILRFRLNEKELEIIELQKEIKKLRGSINIADVMRKQKNIFDSKLSIMPLIES